MQDYYQDVDEQQQEENYKSEDVMKVANSIEKIGMRLAARLQDGHKVIVNTSQLGTIDSFVFKIFLLGHIVVQI